MSVNLSGKTKRRVFLFATLAASLCFLAVVEARRYAIEKGRFAPTGKVVFKSASDLAKIPVERDSYPCFIAEPSKLGSSNRTLWAAEVRQCMPSLHDDAAIEQYEVDLRSGKFILRKTDLFVADDMPLAITRAYGIWDTHSYAFGVGSSQPYDIFPYGSRNPYSYMELALPDGDSLFYARVTEGVSYADAVFEHRGTPDSIFSQSQIFWSRDHWDFHLKNGLLYRFPEAYFSKRGAEGALVAIRDGAGREISLLRDPARNLIELRSPHRHWIRLDYDRQNRIQLATDDGDHSVRYSYDGEGRLTEVDGNGEAWRYAYDKDGMSEVQDSRSQTLLEIGYRNGRVESIKFVNGPTYRFDYLLNKRRNIAETRVEYPAGKFTVFKF